MSTLRDDQERLNAALRDLGRAILDAFAPLLRTILLHREDSLARFHRSLERLPPVTSEDNPDAEAALDRTDSR
jgi:transposase